MPLKYDVRHDALASGGPVTTWPDARTLRSDDALVDLPLDWWASERLKERSARVSAQCQTVAAEAMACVAGEIKPLAHWRRLDEVAAEAEVAKPKSWLWSDAQLQLIAEINVRRLDEAMRNLSAWDGFFEATVTITDGQVAAVDMPPWPTPEELSEVWRGLAEKARQSAPPARAPFPARALQDRPWDISALVEE